MGFDSANEGGDARSVEINADGPGMVTARLANVGSGTVRLCILRQDQQEAQVCNGRDGNGAARVQVTDTGSSVWLISARGREADIAPTADLRITFYSVAPAATLRSFRYLGTSDPARNGFTAEVVPSVDGTIRVQGNFEENAFTHRVVVAPGVYDVTGGPANTFETNPDPAVTAGATYRVSVSSPDATTNPAGPAFVVATIIWP